MSESDLISTPSQAQSPVSNEAFEALIDLLASDGVDETPSKLASVGSSQTRPQANMTLRDPSGKLDFDKIRMMFAVQNQSLRVQSPTHDDGDSDDEHHEHQSVSTVPSRPPSPKLVPVPVGRLPAGHRRSSTFGNQPWAAIHVHENAAKVEDVASTPTRQLLSFDELNTALKGAHEEVRSLQQQYDELWDLVAKRLGTELRDRAKPCPAQDKGRDGSSQTRVGAIVPPGPAPPDSDVPPEIAELSEGAAKRALSAIADTLNLCPSALANMSTKSPRQNLFPPNPARQHDIASIARALKFLGTVDELVWRRSSGASGPRTLLPTYSDENVVALVARLELWERAVRRTSRI